MSIHAERPKPHTRRRTTSSASREWARLLVVWPVLAVLLVVGGLGSTVFSQQNGLPDEVTLPADASGDEIAAAVDTVAPAGKPPIAFDNLFDIIMSGGWLMAPIIVASFVLMVFGLERLIVLRRGRVMPGPFVKRFMHQLREGQLDKETALEVCEEGRCPVADVFSHAARKWGRPAVEVEQAVIDAGERLVSQLRRHLRVISGVATVSPLLGLLGTVTGMISAFNAVSTAGAMGRPELLAGGISEALITTAAGLSVAIPALILHMVLVGRVDRMIIDIDGLGQEIVDHISAEAQETKPKPRRTKSKAA